MKSQNNSVTLVIGGSGSLGIVVIETLKKSHNKLIFTYCNNEKDALALQSRLDCPGMQLDLKDFHKFEGFIEAIEKDFGPIDNLIFCSGASNGGSIKKFLDTTISEWDDANQVIVKGCFFLTQAVARKMIKREKGKIIFTGSMDGIKKLPSPVVYTSNKSAVAGMMRALSKELGKYGILINSVEPGLLEGGISSSLGQDIKSEFKQYSCMGRLGKFQEIANIIAWLASDKNTYLIGQSISVDGGI